MDSQISKVKCRRVFNVFKLDPNCGGNATDGHRVSSKWAAVARMKKKKQCNTNMSTL